MVSSPSPFGASRQKTDLFVFDPVRYQNLRFLRYPGGKQRILRYILPYLPTRTNMIGRFVEPFVGSGAVFFALNPRRALLSDINKDLIDLYRGIRLYPSKVWKIFRDFPRDKNAYYKIRGLKTPNKDLAFVSARILYLNRTCFKGMWRHNSQGEFNIGYGGQDRRWTITEDGLLNISKRLKNASLKCSDFEAIIDSCEKEDFVFADPPYSPGKCEFINEHYTTTNFTHKDHERLSNALNVASKRSVRWAMTTTSHPDILKLFKNNLILPLPLGAGNKPGILTRKSGEVLICNYKQGII